MWQVINLIYQITLIFKNMNNETIVKTNGQ